MAKIDQVEHTLLEIGGAAFQKMCDEIFYLDGYESISSIGAVTGKQKVRKGTPDSYIPLPDGTFVFIECTTQDKLDNKSSFFSKLNEDIDKCFDEAKTGIVVSKISLVVLCVTSKFSPIQYDTLRTRCQQKGSSLELYPIDRVAKKIIQFPYLGEEYLGISIDTNQILPPHQFVKEYEKSKFKTSLSTPFQHREELIEQATSLLKEDDILVVSGPAGVGKSRFSIQLLEKWCSENDGYTQFCVTNKGADIHRDIRSYFTRGSEKKYIILLDDANRMTKILRSFLPLLKEFEAGEIKFVITVRDYATDKVFTELSEHSLQRLAVPALEDKEIEAIIKSPPFGFSDRRLIRSILRISGGNPRLAVMASTYIKENSNITFDDIHQLYDAYYGKAFNEVVKENDDYLIKSLVLISFYKTVQKGQIEANILQVFQLTEEEFWKAMKTLNESELVDLFENDIARISDQVFATYCLHYGFFGKGELPLDRFLLGFKKYGQQLKDTIYPVANTFGFPSVERVISSLVDNHWSRLVESGEVLPFAEIFWPFAPEKTLITINNTYLSNPWPDIFPYEELLKRDNTPPAYGTEDARVSILTNMLRHQANHSWYKTTIDIALNFLLHDPTSVKTVGAKIISAISFNPEDQGFGFKRQRLFVRRLHSRLKEHEVFTQLLILAGQYFLKFCFDFTESANRGRSINITTMTFPESSGFREIRDTVFDDLFELKSHRQLVVSLLHGYMHSNSFGKADKKFTKAISERDTQKIIPFLESLKDDLCVDYQIFARDYFRSLIKDGIPIDQLLIDSFRREEIELSEILSQDYLHHKRRWDYDKKFDREQYDTKKKEEIFSFIKGRDDHDTMLLLEKLKQIVRGKSSQENWSYSQSLLTMFNFFLEQSSDLFLSVLETVMKDEELYPLIRNYIHWIVRRHFHEYPNLHYKLFNILPAPASSEAMPWYTSFFSEINDEEVAQIYSDKIRTFAEELSGRIEFFSLDFLLLNSEEFALDILNLLIERSGKKDNTLRLSFSENSFDKHSKWLNNHVDLFTEMYMLSLMNNEHFDSGGKVAKEVYKNDIYLPLKVLSALMDREKEFVVRQFPHHNFSFIWEEANYDILEDLVNVYVNKDYYLSDFEHNANKLFKKGDKEKQIDFLKKYLLKNINDFSKVQVAFNIVVYSTPSHIDIVAVLLVQNGVDISCFDSLSFFQNRVYSGSRIPTLEGRIDFIDSLKSKIDELPDSYKFLEYQSNLNSRISEIKRDILRERRNEFSRLDW